MSREQLHLNIEAFIPFSPIGLSSLGAESSAARLVWSDGVHCLYCSLNTWSTFLFSEFHCFSSSPPRSMTLNDSFLSLLLQDCIVTMKDTYLVGFIFLHESVSSVSWFMYCSFCFLFFFYKPPRFACVSILGEKDPLEKEMATHSSTLAWRIPWTEETGKLQSMGLRESDMLSDYHFHFHRIHSRFML